MKKGRIWAISLIFVLVGLIILSFSLFGLDEIKLHFMTDTTLFQKEDVQTEVIASGKFVNKSCVLFINKEKYVGRLEKNNPYLKVFGIETIFPNDFVVHCGERTALFSVQIENKCFVLDKDLKILNIFDENFVSEQNNEILVTGLSFENEYEKGDFISEEKTEILKNFAQKLLLTNRIESMQKAVFKQIEFCKNYSEKNGKITDAITLIDFAGLKIKIIDAIENLEAKLEQALVISSSLSDIDRNSVVLYVFDRENRIYVREINVGGEDE